MSEASDRVRKAVEDARSGAGQADGPFFFEEPDLDSPLDRETLDERASTQMGGWESPRRDAN